MCCSRLSLLLLVSLLTRVCLFTCPSVPVCLPTCFWLSSVCSLLSPYSHLLVSSLLACVSLSSTLLPVCLFTCSSHLSLSVRLFVYLFIFLFRSFFFHLPVPSPSLSTLRCLLCSSASQCGCSSAALVLLPPAYYSTGCTSFFLPFCVSLSDAILIPY